MEVFHEFMPDNVDIIRDHRYESWLVLVSPCEKDDFLYSLAAVMCAAMDAGLSAFALGINKGDDTLVRKNVSNILLNRKLPTPNECPEGDINYFWLTDSSIYE